jgi:YVTN family beta-propeller protein
LIPSPGAAKLPAMNSLEPVRRSLPAASVLLAVLLLAGSCRTPPRPPDAVGPAGENRTILPVSQVLTPAGKMVDLPGLRPQAVALSPDGRILAVSGKTSEVLVVDPERAVVLDRVPLPSEKAEPHPATVSTHILAPDDKGQVSFTGLAFSPDGSRLYLSNVNGSIKVFAVEGAGVRGLFSIPLPPAGAPRRKEEIPAGIAVSPDGARLLVALNLSNRIGEIEAATGKVLRLIDVGVAPYDVVLAGTKAYVSNWGGRRPDGSGPTGPAGRGTLVRVDPVRHIASEGSVSVVDLTAWKVAAEVLTGLHASALAVSPDRRHVLVANAGSDTVTVLDAGTDRIVETIPLSWRPGDLFGASPNALAFDPSGRTLFVANGTQNAVAVVSFRPGASRIEGLIPVGWFPGALAHDSRRNLIHVGNVKGVGSGVPPGFLGKTKFNSHQTHGTLSIVPVPAPDALPALTGVSLENLRRRAIEEAALPPRPGQPPRPVPERAGEPSVFRHVVYIIKENRTYDQVLGDMPEGYGDPSLCIYGEEVTPNQHKIAREFVLLDNTYCSGVLSADGHQWAASAFATDYMEKSFAGFPRSYPDGMDDDDVDALAYAPSGFLWDNALARGKTVRDYGEFAIAELGWKDPARKGAPGWIDIYRDFVAGTGLVRIGSRPAIESLRQHLVADTVGWTMDVPDVFRSARFIEDLRRFEQAGTLPDLSIICLPNDHTSGTKAGMPTPEAHAADNDLAFGRIVEAISKSRFWPETCIFAIEDDPQDGWDHVSAYRTTAYVVSPYTRRGAVVSAAYNQPGMLRTIELVLGLPPMNVFDASATPLRDCFVDVPDLRPFEAVPNRIPLDRLNPPPAKVADPVLRADAVASATLPLDEVDRCPEDLLNRILWRAARGSAVPYPIRATRAGGGDGGRR